MTTKRPVGRPPSGLPKRVRRNLNIQRNEYFDAHLLHVREMIAALRQKPIDDISQTEAVRVAIDFYRLNAKSDDQNNQVCPRCNGVGYVTVHNGDDDETCECCGQVIHADEIPY